MSPQVLILGSQGRFGAAAARAFAQNGWRVLCHTRRAAGVLPAGARAVSAPLAQTERLAQEAAGSSLVVHAVNVPYPRWEAEALPAAEQGMALAQRLGATFMLPGNVYNFGASMPALLAEGAPQAASTRKGRLRVQMEQRMQERAASGMQGIVLRAGDYFGAGRGAWLDLVIAKSIAKGKLSYPGALDRPHAWAYLPDLAQAAVALANRSDLPRFARYHFAGHTVTGAELLAGLETAARALGVQRAFSHSKVPWGVMRALGLFVPMLRELSEMAYLWDTPHALDGAALRAAVGDLPETPLPQALRAALADLGVGAA